MGHSWAIQTGPAVTVPKEGVQGGRASHMCVGGGLVPAVGKVGRKMGSGIGD
jgi:hypothetical protein